MQSTWRGDNALAGTFYGISESGWMTSDVFAEWFERFCKLVTERPLLLILDGHLTHVSILVIEKAVEEDVTILKLPPHATDVLQPLDVSCFGPLKRLWEQSLNSLINEFGVKEPIRKGRFVNKLGEVWHKGLSPENIIAGFKWTGIFPVDRTKYQPHRFDPRLLKWYDSWLAPGKPANLQEELATSITTPRKFKEVSATTAREFYTGVIKQSTTLPIPSIIIDANNNGSQMYLQKLRRTGTNSLSCSR